MKKAKILGALILALLVAVVLAAFAFPALAAEPTDPADADDFLEVVWNEDETQFTLKGIVGGPWDAKYADAKKYPFLVATMPTADKGTVNAEYNSGSIVDNKGNAVSVPFHTDLYNTNLGAMNIAKNTLMGAGTNKWIWNDENDHIKGGYFQGGSIDAYIFMRSDYTMKKSSVAKSDAQVSSTDTSEYYPKESYANLSQVLGNLTIDMCGHSIIADETYASDIPYYNTSTSMQLTRLILSLI